MKQRVTDQNCRAYKNYGGRGIDADPRWLNSFEVFLADVGRRPNPELTLERIDNDKGYWPWNVKWATQKEQLANKRPRGRGQYKIGASFPC